MQLSRKFFAATTMAAIAGSGFILPRPAAAGIMVDNTANTGESFVAVQGEPNTQDWESLKDFTVGNHSNRLLVVSVAGEEIGSINDVILGGSDPNGTYEEGWSGGTQMTKAVESTSSENPPGDSSNNDTAAIYYTFAPPTGDSNIYVEVDNQVDNGDEGSANFQFGVGSFYNVAPNAPITATDTDDQDVLAAELTISASEGGLVFDVFDVNGDTTNSQSLSATGGQSVLYNDNSDKSGGFTSAAGYEIPSVDGPQVQTWTNTDASEHGYAAVSFDAVPEPSSLALIGVGSLLLGFRPRRRA